MRILMNSEHLSPNTGISVHTVEVAEALAARGHEIDLLYMRDGPFADRYAAFCRSMTRVPVFDLGVRRAWRDAPRLVPAVVAGARCRPDVIYANRFRPLPWALATGWIARAPVVCHLHGLIGIDHPTVNRMLGRHTEQFLAVSQFVKDAFVEWGGDATRVGVVHNGIDPAAYPVGGSEERRAARRELGIPEDGDLVLFCGRIDPTKGVDLLLDAVALADPAGSWLGAVVMGPVGDEAYAARLRRHPVASRTHWVPMRTDVVTGYHAADVIAVPSRIDEAFGRVVIEGLATGRPVVATAVGGVPEVLGRELADFVVPRDDAGALAAAIARAFSLRSSEPGLGARCAAYVSERFTIDRQVDAVEASLAAAARGRRSGARH